MDHLIQLFALVGDNEMALEHIRRSSYYSNYRWVTATRLSSRCTETRTFEHFWTTCTGSGRRI